ncbi:hypothetical protein [Methylobacterium frigidaeris]|uniref:Uncharacterized protein n=1 Tax=Methylobacterium frigidaeris TaxID=2038277 RepID=A0AA37HAD2_9HYPH|nr:hypothetical protein [Methylobacterium frigidaeris]PIK72102.1 hypothetical protein CS379_15820 [Methylobacterium frigidaeris]GJD62255.1 hypothetical protein MPEAHAMD_2408 [Methylobacterium frigidaeris]
MASGLQPEGQGEPDRDGERERAQLARDILVHNEQVKLTANLMNIGAAGFAITGIVAPLTAAMATTGRVTAPALALMVVWFVLGVGLHFGARLTLTTLR